MADLFLGSHIPDDITACAETIGPAPDDVLSAMETRARDEGFPIVGPTVGAWLGQLVRLTGASRIFEFGSGFGYSAYWFARELPLGGEVVLTEMDEGNLDLARQFLGEGGLGDHATYEVGHAVETAREYSGPFDIALLDIEKYEYVDAFEVIRDAIPSGGVVVPDNIMTAGREHVDDTVDYRALQRALIEGDSLEEMDLDEEARRGTAGVLEFLESVGDDPEFETTLLPLGDGVTVSSRHR